MYAGSASSCEPCRLGPAPRQYFYMAWVLWASVVAITLFASSCASPTCPTTVDQARSQRFLETLPTDAVVGVARVPRFVNAPDPQARGYDLDFQTAIKGNAAGVSTFLRLSEAIPGIQQGDRVS